MFRKRLVATCIVATAALGIVSTSSDAVAQEVIDLDEEAAKAPKKPAAKPAAKPTAKPVAKGDAKADPKKGDAKADPKKGDAKKGDGKGGVDIDLDEGQEGKEQGPVVAGQMTEEAAAAKKLFDRERWNEAAQALFRVVNGETSDDPGNKQLAQYYLAIALYRLKFYQASYALFSQIADNKNHLKFKETLLWLAKLATQLPEPADIIERVGKYSDDQVARFDNEQQRDLFWQLNYMLGRYKYRNRQYEEAIRLFQKVDRKSEYYVKSQFFTGISYVQLRKSVPAVQSFQRIEKVIDEGASGVEDEDRLRDLAYLSMARTYYSASIKLDPESNTPQVDEKKLSAAVKYWNQIEPASEYWLDALFEQSWGEMISGPGGFDTELMRRRPGLLVAKGGAEGYQGVGIAPNALHPGSPALGLVLKVADGSSRAVHLTTLEILRQLGALDEADFDALAEFGYGPLLSLRNQRNLVTGEARPVFTLDYSGARPAVDA